MQEIYKDVSFCFKISSFNSSKTNEYILDLINTFSYLPFNGPIILKKPKLIITVFESYVEFANEFDLPENIYVCRWVYKSFNL